MSGGGALKAVNLLWTVTELAVSPQIPENCLRHLFHPSTFPH